MKQTIIINLLLLFFINIAFFASLIVSKFYFFVIINVFILFNIFLTYRVKKIEDLLKYKDEKQSIKIETADDHPIIKSARKRLNR